MAERSDNASTGPAVVERLRAVAQEARQPCDCRLHMPLDAGHAERCHLGFALLLLDSEEHHDG